VEAFFVTAALVAIGEIGDKTQLLSLMLAARYRRPLPIILGITSATLANHAIAAAAGIWLRGAIDLALLRWLVGLSFLGIAAWTLTPDAADEERPVAERYGVFLITLVAFFLAEMGDKTQVATVALAARYAAFASVVLGTTAGMMIANVPVVFLGERLAARLPLKLLRRVAAACFALLGVVALI